MYDCIIIGGASEICTDEILESHSVTKSFVPKLSMTKFDTRDDQNFPDEQHPPEVRCGGI